MNQDLYKDWGLSGSSPKDWKSLTPEEIQADPITRLKPKSELHESVKKYLLERLELSEKKMGDFYARWRLTESKLQAGIAELDWDKLLKQLQQKQEGKEDGSESVLDLTIQVPYMFSTINTIVTYLFHTFCARKPMFQVGSYKQETIKSAHTMETVLQYNADAQRLIKQFYKFLWDSQVYGVGILRSSWLQDSKLRTVWAADISGNMVRSKELRTVYEGNSVIAIDPFCFFPDPNVPMAEVNRRGEFVAWRTFEGKHSLLKAQSEGLLLWVDKAKVNLPQQDAGSDRNFAAGGEGEGQDWSRSIKGGVDYYQVDQISIEIIPAELGLGESRWPQKWLFTILNKDQIVQAVPQELDHGMHPVAVTEPYSFGYGFGQLGIADYLGPIQDAMSWMLNARISNVREILNSTFVVDPNSIEMQDFKQKGHGRILRLKPGALGKDVRAALHQFLVSDVTTNHVSDMKLLQSIGDQIAAVNDNLRGIQSQGGRKSATEVRITTESGASRLANVARLVSAQAVVDLAEQMVSNIQQFISESFYVTITGKDGQETPLYVSPDMLSGDFHFPIHDGTLPLDKTALIDSWTQVLQLVAGDQELRQTFSLVKLVEHVADLAGAKGMDLFRVNVQTMPPDQAPGQGQVPVEQALAQLGGMP